MTDISATGFGKALGKELRCLPVCRSPSRPSQELTLFLPFGFAGGAGLSALHDAIKAGDVVQTQHVLQQRVDGKLEFELDAAMMAEVSGQTNEFKLHNKHV